ncbi:hypothetical protein C8R47DRAFT_1189505 [Mycena vitilis]|nr:hypothetical protein C8R47DRAFT_1189505 [Mycena vitilis]
MAALSNTWKTWHISLAPLQLQLLIAGQGYRRGELFRSPRLTLAHLTLLGHLVPASHHAVHVCGPDIHKPRDRLQSALYPITVPTSATSYLVRSLSRLVSLKYNKVKNTPGICRCAFLVTRHAEERCAWHGVSFAIWYLSMALSGRRHFLTTTYTCTL